jgi:hypothetical protein
MKDSKAIDAVIKLLDAGGLTQDLRIAPLEQVINLRNLLDHWCQIAEGEIQDRVERTRSR